VVDRSLTAVDSRLLDWAAPWFAAVQARGRCVASAPDPRAALNDAADRLALRNAGRRPIRFVDGAAAAEEPYEAYVARTGQVPTRTNLHDMFNALVWLAFPRVKARLNALQASAIEADGVGAQRGPLRDAATLIDENGVLLVTTRSDLIGALRARNWTDLFVRNRGAWSNEVRPVVFGHALMEKLARPYKAITGHAVVVPLAATTPDPEIDAVVAKALDPELTPRQLLALPVLGIPGWAQNDEPGYYEDITVFRPPKARGEAEAGRGAMRACPGIQSTERGQR
jgi:hypothetical protein